MLSDNRSHTKSERCGWANAMAVLSQANPCYVYLKPTLYSSYWLCWRDLEGSMPQRLRWLSCSTPEAAAQAMSGSQRSMSCSSM